MSWNCRVKYFAIAVMDGFYIDTDEYRDGSLTKHFER
jgi:hypothetical protein